MVTTNRLTGLVAPFDVETTIQKLMKAERMPLDTLEKKKYSNQYKREEYLKVNSQLLLLQKKANDMKLQANMNKMTTVVTGNSGAVTVSSNSGTISGTYSIDVNQVATRASVTSDTLILNSAAFSSSSSLKSQEANLKISTNAAPNNTIASDGTTAADYSFAINGVTITVDADNESMDAIVKKINQSTAGVTAVFDKTSGKMNIQAKTDGLVNGATKDQADISFTDITGDFLKNVIRVTSDPANSGVVKTSATGSSISVNGISMTSNTNEYTVNNLKITAVAKTNGTSATIEAKQDTQAMVDTIKDYIKVYNDTLGLLNTDYSEKHDRNYKPLTSEERKAMTDKEAELWDTAAKKGMLYRDSLVGQARSALKNSAIEKIDSGNPNYQTLGSIGISTTSWQDNGILTVDETKLKDALEKDPDAVLNMFTSSDTATPAKKGFAYRLLDSVKPVINSIKSKAGYSSTEQDNSDMGKELKTIDLKMSDMEVLLQKKEDNYYRQFSQMEKMISQYQSQSSAFAQS